MNGSARFWRGSYNVDKDGLASNPLVSASQDAEVVNTMLGHVCFKLLFHICLPPKGNSVLGRHNLVPQVQKFDSSAPKQPQSEPRRKEHLGIASQTRCLEPSLPPSVLR